MLLPLLHLPGCCCCCRCCQAMPSVGTAMFYFKTNKLGFDAEFFGRVKLVAALADLLGECCATGGDAALWSPTARRSLRLT
jgi:hypothetical protein